MALRLLEIVVPAARAEVMRAVVAEREPATAWRQPLDDGLVLFRLLVEAERTGPLVEDIDERLRGTAEYRLTILPVEATLPRSEQEAAAEAERNRPSPIAGLSREELYNDIHDMAKPTRVFVVTVALSVVVAATGMMRNDLAILIGAMVIAPMLGPNVALAFGAAVGDAKLVRLAVRTNAVGVVITLGLSALLGALLRVDFATPAIAARTQVAFADISLALAAGAAGTLAVTRGVPTTLVGVMVAVALLPPATTVGMAIGAAELQLAGRAGLLLAINVVCVNLAAIVTFQLHGLRPRAWWEAERAKRSYRIALAIWVGLLVLLALLVLAASST